MKPNFLVIGTPKSGTTWLQHVLKSHPDIFIPEERNEIKYFNRYFNDKPLEWYLQFFGQAGSHKAIGEVTPGYLYVPDKRVFRSVDSIKKFIVILRDPVDRCISHYKFRMRMDNFKGSFSEFLNKYGRMRALGLYGKNLKEFIEEYSAEQILVLFYEECTSNPQEMAQLVARFLGVKSSGFGLTAMRAKVNAGFRPNRPGMYKAAIRLSSRLVALEMYGLRNFLKKIAKPVVSAHSGATIYIAEEEESQLADFYKEDVELIKSITGRKSLPWPRFYNSESKSLSKLE